MKHQPTSDAVECFTFRSSFLKTISLQLFLSFFKKLLPLAATYRWTVPPWSLLKNGKHYALAMLPLNYRYYPV